MNPLIYITKKNKEAASYTLIRTKVALRSLEWDLRADDLHRSMMRWIELRRRDIGLVIVRFVVECCDEAVNVVDGSCGMVLFYWSYDLSLFSFLSHSAVLLTESLTQSPMLDRTDFASWKQRIQLYFWGKENGVNILKSIDEGPFQMETLRETVTEGTEGETIHDYYVRFVKLINDMRNIKMTMSRMQLNFKFINNMLPEWGRFITAMKLNKGLRDSNYDQLYAYLKQHEVHADEKKMMLDRFTQHTVDPLALMVDRIEDMGTMHGVQVQLVIGELRTEFADDCDAFDSDADEVPTAHTMFMANLSSADPVYDEAGPFYDSDVLSEVHDHDDYQDAVCEHHEVHEMHDDVQPNYVVDSHTGYTSDSNMIPYDQYVMDNTVQIVQSNVSTVPNDAYMMILNDVHEPPAQHVYVITQTKVVDKSLTAEVAKYKEQVKQYERRARFELTKKEHKIDEELRIVITDRNIKEENLKKGTSFYKNATCFYHQPSQVNDSITPKVLAPGMYAIDLEPIPPCLRNNREVHLDYLKHLKESVATLHEIVEEAKVERPPRVDPTLLNDFNMDTNRNSDDVPPPEGGDLPVPDLQTIEELCQPTLNGRGGPIALIEIQAKNFGLKNDMIQQVQNSCQFHGLPGDDANKHLDKFLHVTQRIKVNGVIDDALRLFIFPHSLTHHATAWFDHLPRNSKTTFELMAKMFLGKYFSPSMVTKLRNEITNFHQRPDESLFKACER
uniref:Reverse transcriptase domain-containing protein n=1 Tax=Tanacetum cinerariifolium TaxID=118510 RepID=A0A699GT49_TANCI|nr:reverse transcriptase domain-containing protein [Tanacetum cinerariifolium]